MKKSKHTEEKKSKKKGIGFKIFIFFLIIFACAGIWFAKRVNDLDGNWLAALFGHNKNTLKNLDEIQVLVLGESTGMSDTIIVCSYNPRTQKASMLSIPRDTYVGTGYSAYNKINSLYSSGETPEKTLAAVNELTGLNIKNYIIIDTEALVKLVDLIGGVEFDVPKDMKYDDSEQNLHINLKKGYQKLTGNQVEQVVRYRHDNDGSSYSYEYGNEDYGRMRTQRSMIVAVAKQTVKLKNITEIKNIVNIIQEYVDTNMDFSKIKDYIPYAVKIDFETIEAEQLPGASDKRNGIWYFFNDEEETTSVVDRLFRGIEEVPEENVISE